MTNILQDFLIKLDNLICEKITKRKRSSTITIQDSKRQDKIDRIINKHNGI